MLLLQRGNLSTIGEGYETVFFYANHGLTLHLFNNPFHRARLREVRCSGLVTRHPMLSVGGQRCWRYLC